MSEPARSSTSIQFLVAGASTVVIIAGLRAAAPIILPFLMAVLLAVVNVPLMNWLVRMHVPKPVAVLLTILTAVAIVGILVAVVATSLNQLTAALNQLTVVVPLYQQRFQRLAASVVEVAETYGLPADQFIAALAPSGAVDLMRGMIGNTLRAVGSFLSNSFLVLLTVIFILFEAAGFGRKLSIAFGVDGDPFGPLRRMATDVQKYLVAKTAISIATGVVIGLWVAAMGVNFPLVWGVLAFMFNFIPNLGSVVAAVPAVVLALVQFGPAHAATVSAGYLVVNLLFGSVVEPTLLGRRLGLSTLVVFMSLVFWGWVWGPVGMLFSVPLTMVIKIALENTTDFRWVAVMLDANPAPALTRKR